MSEKNGRHARNPARAQARAGQRKNENVQFVRRVPEVNGTAYTEEMSKAYWKGLQDGESTASRMVKRADPRNVRVRSLAVISDEPQEQGIAVNAAEAETGLAQAQQSTAVAVLDKPEELAVPNEEKGAGIVPAADAADMKMCEMNSTGEEIIGLERHLASDENSVDIMNMNETKRDAQLNRGSAEPAPQVTYALGRDELKKSDISLLAWAEKAEDSSAKSGNGIFNAGGERKKPAEKSAGKKADGEFVVQPWREISLLRKVIVILSVVLFLYALSPLVLGIFNIGIVPLVLIAWFFLVVSLLWNHIENCRSRILNGLFAAVAFIVVLGIIGMAFISGKMIGASMKTLPEDRTDVTVVVLGCLVIEDQPSLMLERRLRTAAEYLLSNPDAYCIVTGGQGENEDYPEAVVMRNYLVEAGVSDERIIVEKKSTSTVENIEFAADLIEKYNCHEDVVIVSDRFHQYRAGLAAKDAGLNSYAMPCETAWYLVAHYWFREMAGIAQIWLQG